MAVVVKYVVERNGKEVMTFADKKEADAYDKQLDIAEGLYEFIVTAELDIEDKTLDDLTFFLAKNRDRIAKLLKGQKIEPEEKSAAESATKEAQTASTKTASANGVNKPAAAKPKGKTKGKGRGGQAQAAA